MMLRNFSALTAVLAISTVLAAPAVEHQKKEARIEDIQCRCLTFRGTEEASPCNFFESKGFGWRSAQMLAAQYDISVQFASKSTIEKILAIPTPLPDDVLETTRTGAAESTTRDANTSQNKIVCGLGREVRHMTHEHEHRQREPQFHFAGQVLAWLMLFVIVYAAGEYLWIKYTSRRPVKLKGDEKPLVTQPRSVSSEKDTPSDSS